MSAPPKGTPQDMPPPEGYASIAWKRSPLRVVFGTKLTVGLFLGMTGISAWLYKLNWVYVKRHEVEMRSARHVIFPLLIAERDRMFLKQLKKNREDERKLMKNVPEWEVGNYYGEPVYITAPEDRLIEPSFWEFYAHASTDDANSRALRRNLT